jgi:hypothetical protein
MAGIAVFLVWGLFVSGGIVAVFALLAWRWVGRT